MGLELVGPSGRAEVGPEFPKEGRLRGPALSDRLLGVEVCDLSFR